MVGRSGKNRKLHITGYYAPDPSADADASSALPPPPSAAPSAVCPQRRKHWCLARRVFPIICGEYKCG
eukprot:351805-Chlamydomonas_euryale.AAC.2